MSYSQENGFTPKTVEAILDEIRVEINDQFSTSYTEETFVGTGWYSLVYKLAQKIQLGQVKTSEIFLKLQEYINTTNLKIQRPSVSLPGIIDSMKLNGWVASVKKNAIEDAGTVSICVDVDDTDPDYEEMRLEICTFIKDFIGAEAISLGTEEEAIVLSNGQSFDFKFFLPDRITVKLRVICEVSENNLLVIPSLAAIRQKVLENIANNYRLGLNFEPQKYFTLADAPWAGSILVEWTDDDGENWESEIYESEFDELFTIDIEDIDISVE